MRLCQWQPRLLLQLSAAHVDRTKKKRLPTGAFSYMKGWLVHPMPIILSKLPVDSAETMPLGYVWNTRELVWPGRCLVAKLVIPPKTSERSKDQLSKGELTQKNQPFNRLAILSVCWKEHQNVKKNNWNRCGGRKKLLKVVQDMFTN